MTDKELRYLLVGYKIGYGGWRSVQGYLTQFNKPLSYIDELAEGIDDLSIASFKDDYKKKEDKPRSTFTKKYKG